MATFHPGQLLQFVELLKSKKLGKGFGSRSQKWVRDVIESWNVWKLEEYTLKYPTALNSLVRLVHPRLTDERAGISLYVLDGKAAEATGERQKALYELKKLTLNETSYKKIALTMLEKRIPWDAVKGFAGLNGPIAISSMTQMGLTALLLNLRSLDTHGVFNDVGLQALELRLNEVEFGRSVPLDFAKPYIHTGNQKVKDLLLKSMAKVLAQPFEALANLDVAVSIDISGSMQGEPLQTSGLLAAPFLKAKSLWFTTFDTNLYNEGHSVCPRVNGLPASQQLKNLLSLRTNGGTDVAIPIRTALASRKKVDLFVLVTDEQQNSGSPLRNVWSQYRASVNPEAQLWIVNATNYQWHSADMGDPSVTVYQKISSAMFKNIEFLGTRITEVIEGVDLNAIRARKTVEVAEEEATEETAEA